MDRGSHWQARKGGRPTQARSARRCSKEVSLNGSLGSGPTSANLHLAGEVLANWRRAMVRDIRLPSALRIRVDRVGPGDDRAGSGRTERRSLQGYPPVPGEPVLFSLMPIASDNGRIIVRIMHVYMEFPKRRDSVSQRQRAPRVQGPGRLISRSRRPPKVARRTFQRKR